MSAERNALDAAFQYSAKLEEQIKHLEKDLRDSRSCRRGLESKIRDVKDTLGVGERNNPLMQESCEASMPQGTCSDEAMKGPQEDCPRCKNCGAPI